RPASKFEPRPATTISPTVRSAFVPCRYAPGSYTSKGTGTRLALTWRRYSAIYPAYFPSRLDRERHLRGGSVVGVEVYMNLASACRRQRSPRFANPSGVSAPASSPEPQLQHLLLALVEFTADRDLAVAQIEAEEQRATVAPPDQRGT